MILDVLFLFFIQVAVAVCCKVIFFPLFWLLNNGCLKALLFSLSVLADEVMPFDDKAYFI